MREWGSGPLDDERHGAAEVKKMNEEQREGLVEKLAFDASLEVLLEGATDEEVDSYRNGVM